MERHIERSKLSLSSFMPEKVVGFGKIVQNMFDLPHPAMRKVEFNGNVKATDMSKLVFNILDHLINAIFDGKKYHLNEINSIQTVRFCGKTSPCLVRLLSIPGHQAVHTIDLSSNELIQDNPAMNIQYISSFGLNIESEKLWRDEKETRKKSRLTVPSSCFLFEKVCLGDDHTPIGSLSNATMKLKKR